MIIETAVMFARQVEPTLAANREILDPALVSAIEQLLADISTAEQFEGENVEMLECPNIVASALNFAVIFRRFGQDWYFKLGGRSTAWENERLARQASSRRGE